MVKYIFYINKVFLQHSASVEINQCHNRNINQLNTQTNMIIKHILIALFVISTTTPLIECITGTPIIGPTNKYVNTASYIFSTDPYYGVSNTALNSLSFNIIFPTAYTTTTYQFGCTIEEIQIDNLSQKINYAINIGNKYVDKMQILYSTMMPIKIKTLVLRYITISPGFNNYYFKFLSASPATTLINGQNYTINTLGEGPFPTTGTTNFLLAINGVDADLSDASNQIDLYIAATLTSSTTFKFLVSTISNKSFMLNSILIVAFCYNVQSLAANSISAKYSWGSFSSVNQANTLFYTDTTTNIVRSFNTIVGVRAYHINNQNFLHLLYTINPSTSIVGSSKNSFLFLDFDYIILQFSYCPSLTPFLMVSTNICYDICPERYCSDTSIYQCTACANYDCYRCLSNTSCSECSSTVDYRIIDSTTLRCIPLPGYYDDGLSHSLALPCMANCISCNTLTTCATCNTSYTFISGSCVVDCSLIAKCNTCDLKVDLTVNCLTCLNGYTVAANNTCIYTCADGYKVTQQACDDGNSNNGDGCSGTCTLQLFYYCIVDASFKSICTSCIANCTTCINNTQCQICDTNFILSSNSGSCDADCSSITYCITCSLPSTLILNCLSCQNGYYPSSNGSNCVYQCSDGIKVTEQLCDDGNLANNDGCSSTCTLEPRYYCIQNASSTSICNKCLTNCYSCTNSAACINCQPNYAYSTSNATCNSNCGVFTNCLTCNLSACLSCITGYNIDTLNNCQIACGDGLVLPTQNCDDGNSADGDGCNSICLVQNNWVCNINTSISNSSTCSLLTITITLVSINKDPNSNTVIVVYQMQPQNIPSYSTLNWPNVVTQSSNLPISFSSISFDSSTGQLSAVAIYTQNINNQNLILSVTFPSTTPFNMIAANQVTTKLTADNNLALLPYNDGQYQMASILSAIAMVASISSIFLFFLGYFGGKLIGLQLIAVYQITFLSLVTMDDLSPNYYALHNLKYSCGYSIKLFRTPTLVQRRYNPINFDSNFTNNYNLLWILILLPLIIAVIMHLLDKCKYKEQNQTIVKYKKVFLGEYTFYGIMFSTYPAFLAFAIQILHLLQFSDQSVILSLINGGLFLILFLIYFIFFYKKGDYFGEFTQKFNEGWIQTHYYNLLMIERLCSSAILSLVFIIFQPIGLLALLIIQLTLTIVKKPYRKDINRPIFNLTISLIIQVIILVTNLLGSSSLIYLTYAPIAILGLLVLALVYNIYYFIKTLRSEDLVQNENMKIQEQIFLNSQRAKFQELHANIMKNNIMMIMQHQQANEINLDESSTRLKMIEQVKMEINKIKHTANGGSNNNKLVVSDVDSTYVDAEAL